MTKDFRDYHSAVEDLLAQVVWSRLGEKAPLKTGVEKLRAQHVELSDAGALPALVFIQLVGRVTDADALQAYLRDHDRLSEPEDGGYSHSHLLHDALLTPVEYARDDEAAPVWVGGISRVTDTDDGQLLIEVPLQLDAIELRRNRAITDLERLVVATITEFASETPGVELSEVTAERIG